MTQDQSTGHNEILTTKLAPPRLHGILAPRPALLARLEQGLDQKLTLLSAPPGFGKTTLVSQWLHRMRNDELGMMNETSKASPHHSSFIIHHSEIAWLSLDANDNDPARFWRYLISACRNFATDLGASALEQLNRPHPLSFETLLTSFINELAQLPGRFVFILEDYQEINARQIHETMTFLLDHLPPTLHLILITRSDPLLPLARLRARHELNELRAADLRFSSSEIRAFLQQALPFPLSEEAVAHLEARTEGWIAGLHLAVLALQKRQEPQVIEQFIATFAGSHRHILEYLIAEVFGAQPEPLQQFLLQTSFLSRLTGPLCDAVTGRTDGAAVLEQLERANLFLNSLDGAGQWYRYHPLFAEAIHHYARRQLGEAGLRDCYRRAGRWYEQQGMLAEAIEISLTAGEFTTTANLIERLIQHQVNQELHTLRRWLEQLPEELLPEHPALAFAYAFAILFTLDRQAPATMALLERPLQLAEQRWQAQSNWAKLGETQAFRTLAAWWQGDLVQTFSSARRALELLPEDEVNWRGSSMLFAGLEELYAGKLVAAQQTLREAYRLCQAAGNKHSSLAANLILAEVLTGQGALHRAEQLYRQVLGEVSEVEAKGDFFDRGHALIRLADLAFEWDDLESAEQYASVGLELGRQFGVEDFLVNASLSLSRLKQARRETLQARQLLHDLTPQLKRPWLRQKVQAEQARLALRAGDLATVQRWATSYDQNDDQWMIIQQEQEALLLARLFIAQEEAGAALRLLDQWQADAEVNGRGHSVLEILILKALAHYSQADLPQARPLLIQALALAHPEGYRRLFLAEGEPLAALLQASLPELKEEPLRTYAQSLLRAFTDLRLTIDDLRLGAASQSKIQNHLSGLFPEKSKIQNPVDPLSPQEQRVLRLLAAGLSNPEIAEELVVSINTIKTQVKSIYRKLNVNSREEAGDLAYRLNLL
jgi:LuxR family maltose regulon positive regulatory protein